MMSLLQALGVLPFLILAGFAAGVSAAPGVALYNHATAIIAGWPSPWHEIGVGLSLVLAYFAFGFTLIFVAPLLNALLLGRLKAWRGPQVSPGAMRWYVHATLTLLPRATFLDFICATPYINLYYRLMGMKLGHQVTVNTTAIADPSLIEIGDKVTLGGSCSIMGHYAQGGYLVLAPTRIGARATIGLRAIIMGGVTVGERAKVLAGSFVLPKTVIPDGETWGGIPAVKVDLRKGDSHNEENEPAVAAAGDAQGGARGVDHA